LQPDFEAWIDNLEAEGIQLLVVTRLDPAEGLHNIADSEGFPIERRWADSHPERFEPLYGVAEHDSWFRLYRFDRRSGQSKSSRSWPNRRTDLPARSHSYIQVARLTSFVGQSDRETRNATDIEDTLGVARRHTPADSSQGDRSPGCRKPVRART